MSEWWEIWTNGLPKEDRPPKSGHRMAAEGVPFPWRWVGGMVSAILEVIWEMSVNDPRLYLDLATGHAMLLLFSQGRTRPW